MMYVLIGELKGDYDDFYERPTEAIACSESKERLEAHWKEVVPFEFDFVDYRIEKVIYLDKE
ncbi:hypothetical protein LCGC14_2146670 [marine sediment metagenome]|uniref:Uncharacterized protein n=1 Tax=marine sediment metagenome TaxID=412755 RepID=A0A0F9GT49_9ZZZZ